jgi:dethiobiotin synthetase
MKYGRPRTGKIIFITGTDTGVGKTVFTALLLHHLRTSGVHALAMKPFCSGGRADVRLLRAMQDRELSEDEINPFYFPEPVAPLVSARRHNTLISLAEVLRSIKRISHRCECLLIEGSGGLFVPLGENSRGQEYLVSNLIDSLRCETIVVSRNRLGTINHTLLTINGLQNILKKSGAKRVTSAKKIQIALVQEAKSDPSCATNLRILSELCAPIPVLPLRFLGENASKSEVLKKKYKKVKKTLARFCS